MFFADSTNIVRVTEEYHHRLSPQMAFQIRFKANSGPLIQQQFHSGFELPVLHEPQNRIDKVGTIQLILPVTDTAHLSHLRFRGRELLSHQTQSAVVENHIRWHTLLIGKVLPQLT